MPILYPVSYRAARPPRWKWIYHRLFKPMERDTNMQSSKILMLLAAVVLCGGCTSSQAIKDLRQSNRTNLAQIAALKAQMHEKDEQIRLLQNAEPKQDPDMLNKLERAIAEREQMKAALQVAEGRIRDLSTPKSFDLPPALDHALADLARSNPQLMSYDKDRNMIKFRGDFTFSPGSTTIKKSAKSSLTKFASIINSSIATSYKVVVVGHTDNVPVKRVKNKFPTNWHLSVARAISVKDVLGASGVNGTRMGVQGKGEQEPVVPNGAKGAAANRRVEIFLIAANGSAAPGQASFPAPKPAVVTQNDPNARFK
jgi:flagellar motor protein MotB